MTLPFALGSVPTKLGLLIPSTGMIPSNALWYILESVGVEVTATVRISKLLGWFGIDSWRVPMWSITFPATWSHWSVSSSGMQVVD